MSMIEPWHWFVFGIILILLELVITTFALLWFGIAALTVSLFYWLLPNLSTATQVFMWAILASLCTFLWFKYIKPKPKQQLVHTKAQQIMIGQVGMVTQNQVNTQLNIRFPMPILGSDEWPAVCTDEVLIGDRVQVVEITDQILVVKKHITHSYS
ncbi:NfeD family protein [Acinetobacter rathckeae]|uniref:NfeD family protein n=1 Tax=Acinetobacter rathckeae TaxID=2605272 RepID=UPI0018A30746|nr:NfeD family protein [Acinetobacter rathckeae]MBF7686821.1 NfeD family protein [Acinetobacter rathckeae]MBF7695647.1 NfeD family protein [Acinetobacter rathckeae]